MTPESSPPAFVLMRFHSSMILHDVDVEVGILDELTDTSARRGARFVRTTLRLQLAPYGVPTSKRSSIITLFHAFTKSWANRCLPSSAA